MPRKTRSDKIDIVKFMQVGLTDRDLQNLATIQGKYQIHSITDAIRFVLNQGAEKARLENKLLDSN